MSLFKLISVEKWINTGSLFINEFNGNQYATDGYCRMMKRQGMLRTAKLSFQNRLVQR